jgi:hypothetical protein
LKYLKLVCALACLAIVASNIWTMRNWSERRGVSDDLCYLRQAHLFQTHGLQGFHTDLNAETDGYFNRLVTEAGHPEWDAGGVSICHTSIAGTGRLVLQYPPGVGAALALFGEGHQVVAMYAAATILILLMSFVAIALARSGTAIVAAGAFGVLALYFMINPAKASYSIAPTMVLCAVVGCLTARLFAHRAPRSELLMTALTGLLLGLSVDFRVPNLLLFAGYGCFFLIAFAIARDNRTFLQGALFGIAGGIGLAPTLFANAVNAGNPFATTYGGQDVVPPDVSFSITGDYLRDLQGMLIVAAIAWVIALLVRHRTPSLLPVALIVAINLAVNLGYFLSHPVFTQYYLMPIAMLSLWTLMFAFLFRDAANADVSRQPASAMP